jgi:uncharacterized protein
MADRRCGIRAVTLALALVAAAADAKPVTPSPVIDMHMHPSRGRSTTLEWVCTGDQIRTYPVDPKDVGCRHPLRSAASEQDMIAQTLAQYRRFNVRHAVLHGKPDIVEEWVAAAPILFIPASVPADPSAAAIDALKRLHDSGQAAVFGELGLQYEGIRADDPQLEPFWSLAEKLDVPVGIHLGLGVTDAAAAGLPAYRVGLTTPFQLEDVLVNHPKLRIYAMHYGSPLVDEMIAMLGAYSNLYVDVAANDWNLPRAQFYGELKRLVDAGFAKRIMFGSDPGPFPTAIGAAIQSVERAPFLTAEQKRDILYNNAARFLRLSKEQIAKDQRR